MSEALYPDRIKLIRNLGLGVPIFMVMLLAMMILPLPAFLLDLLFTFNISLSIIVLLAGTYSNRPLDFDVFPTILLLATLLRLALNVASTRVVLINGHNGTDAVGKVIQSFGEVVIGGNYAVGLVVFIILVIINFVVVTKGAGRISEVSARFTLDSMPGKQMAIDADLSAGIISQDEAKQRRQDVASEADFYGSMDGASKFVRGDAVAGIMILIINVVGGFAIGVIQHDLSVSDALEIYALLTIGDGLVAQIPSLLLSTAAAIMVTRVSTTHDVSNEVKRQIFTHYKPLAISAIVLGILGLIPGMPHLVFLTFAGLLGFGANYLYQGSKNKKLDDLIDLNPKTKASTNNKSTNQSQAKDKQDEESKEISWDDVSELDDISLEVGFKLINFVDESKDGELMSKIKGVRKKLSQELGFLVPAVHIKDDLSLSPTAYRISLSGVIIGSHEVHPDKDLAISSGKVYGNLEGIKCKDPAFGLDAIWIDKSKKEQAQTLGYTVVDCCTVIATHLSQIIQDHAHEIIGYGEVQKILDIVSKSAPKLIEELVPDKLSLAAIVKIMQNLLTENVPIRDYKTIVETLSAYAAQSQDPGVLTEAVRQALGRMILQQVNGSSNQVPVITLDPNLEQILQQSLMKGSEASMLDPGIMASMQNQLTEIVNKQEALGQKSILLVAPNLRPFLAKILRSSVSSLAVVSFNEVPHDKSITIIGTLGGNNG